MKKTFLFCTTLFVISLMSCGDNNAEGKKLDEQYKPLLEKEYADFPNTELYKTFKERYELLLAITEQISNQDSVIVDEAHILDSLCFESPRETELILEQYEKNGDQPAKVVPFKDYINVSKDINALIVGANFFKQDYGIFSNFYSESSIHNAYTALDKKAFYNYLGEDTSLATYAYGSFAEARIQMDKVNHCKYVFVLKDKLLTNWKPAEGNSEEFIPAIYLGTLYVYNIETKTTSIAGYLLSTNSEEVKYLESEKDITFHNDLKMNINKDLKSQLDTLAGVKGSIPTFMVYH